MTINPAAVRSAYLLAHPVCEYTLAAGRHFDFFDWAGLAGTWRHHRRAQSTEVDHIFGRRGPVEAVEHPSNYMACHTIPHKWKTDNDRDGRIVALYWKWCRGGDHWDLDRMQRVFGQRPLGWLENQLEKDLPQWVQWMAQEVLGKEQRDV